MDCFVTYQTQDSDIRSTSEICAEIQPLMTCLNVALYTLNKTPYMLL